jgi:hypothetical protein
MSVVTSYFCPYSLREMDGISYCTNISGALTPSPHPLGRSGGGAAVEPTANQSGIGDVQ